MWRATFAYMTSAGEVLLAEVVPAEAGDLAGAASETRTNGGVKCDAAAKQVADEGFDGASLNVMRLPAGGHEESSR
jgi:hypothetical protein